MQEKIGANEIKTKLSEILSRVEAGESFTITNRGKSIADVIPSRCGRRAKTEVAIENIFKARKRKMSGNCLRQLREEGRH